MDYAVVVKGLSKQFYRYHADRPWTLHETLVRGLRRLQPAERFWALRDVSFSVAPGRVVGVIGSNGSGKSTLLRLIGGVGRADKGTSIVSQRISGLLDLGTGFHPDLTGAGECLRQWCHQRSHPPRSSSSALIRSWLLRSWSRLSTIPSAPTAPECRCDWVLRSPSMRRPEILLIDEILSVGDHSFQRKCLDRIARFKAEGCTILIVSHDTGQIREFCDEAIWLNAGHLAASGPAHTVVAQYLSEADRSAFRT